MGNESVRDCCATWSQRLVPFFDSYTSDLLVFDKTDSCLISIQAKLNEIPENEINERNWPRNQSYADDSDSVAVIEKQNDWTKTNGTNFFFSLSTFPWRLLPHTRCRSDGIRLGFCFSKLHLSTYDSHAHTEYTQTHKHMQPERDECLSRRFFVCVICCLIICQLCWLTDECSMTAWIVFGCTPWDHWHYRVMIQVQKWDLSIFFAQHEEHGVEQFGDFGQEIDVNTSCLLSILHIVCVRVFESDAKA